MAETGTATRITKVGAVMAPVSDQDRAIEFFVGKLGFELRSDIAYGEGQRWVEVAPQGAVTPVALVPPGEGGEVGVMTGIGVVDEILREGDPVPPMFFFRDPDGNHFLIVER